MLKIIKKHQSVFNLNTGTILIRTFGNSSSLLQNAAESQKINNTSLYKLRKSTGYGLAKCRQALEKFNGNLDEAAKWLEENAQKEGWAKSEKLKDRATTQGTLVFCADKVKRLATIVELNCETDFVAKNEKFLDLSSQLAISILKNVNPSHKKHLLDKEVLYKISFLDDNSRSIGDQIALTIGNIGENMSLRRAVVYNLQPNEQLGWYMHGSLSEPINNCHFGRYGALVNFTMTKHNENYKPFDLGRQIAQHIVGMKPQTIGEADSSLIEKLNNPENPVKIDENETRLILQEFLMKPNTRVLEFLNENNMVVNDFTRFECGEQVEKC